jgi:hypothetical protein
MNGDEDKFLHLKRKEKGSVTFGDNVSAKLERAQLVYEIINLKHKISY